MHGAMAWQVIKKGDTKVSVEERDGKGSRFASSLGVKVTVHEEVKWDLRWGKGSPSSGANPRSVWREWFMEKGRKIQRRERGSRERVRESGKWLLN